MDPRRNRFSSFCHALSSYVPQVVVLTCLQRCLATIGEWRIIRLATDFLRIAQDGRGSYAE